MTTENDQESFAKDKFEPNVQNPAAAHPVDDETLHTPVPETYEDGSPKKLLSTVSALPTDVTVVQDQLVHTHQDTGVRTLVGRIRNGFVEFTKWGERFFEGKPTPQVMAVEGVELPAAVANSSEPLQNDGLPSTMDKHSTLSVTGNPVDVNSHTIANDGLPATYKRQPEVLATGTTLDTTVDAQVKPVPEAPPGTMPSTGMLEGAQSLTNGGAPVASPDALAPAAVAEPSQQPTPVAQPSP